MDKWVLYAILAAIFAGVTGVIAKFGLAGISSELGLALRTCFVFVLVLAFAVCVVPRHEISTLTGSNLLWLGLSGLTTAASWVFYYKAIQQGEVSTVALIDKGSFLVAVVLAWVLLKEKITPQVLVGMGLIVAGLVVVVARK